MMQIYGTKVINLTTGDLTDVWIFFFRSTDNSCREKSAEDIVPERKKKKGRGRSEPYQSE
jgi:hypothetical protein